MGNQAVKVLCAEVIALGLLCGSTNVLAQNIPSGTEAKSLSVDAGVVTYLRNARDEAMVRVTRHETDMVQSSGEEAAVAESVAEEPVEEEVVKITGIIETTEIEATEELESYEVIKEYPITDGNTTKTVLPYKAFGENTNQKRLQLLCETNEVGLRMYDGRYTIAVGTYFGTAIGQYFDLVLENGIVIPCIMGDLKADIHTDERGLFTVASGCMTEFIVDQELLPNKCSATYCYDTWNSKVVNVIVYDKYVDLNW